MEELQQIIDDIVSSADSLADKYDGFDNEPEDYELEILEEILSQFNKLDLN